MGETGTYVLKLKNVGTAPAKDVKFHIACPETLRVVDNDISLSSLDVDEERGALIAIRPTFDGEYLFKVQVSYQSVPTPHHGSKDFNEDSDFVTVVVKLP